MSILDNNFQPDADNQAKIAAKRLINQTKATYASMVAAFNNGSATFWNNHNSVSPQDIATHLGTNAKEVFELHYKLGQFISSIRPEDIAPGLSLIGNFTINEDGTVTIHNNE